MALAAPQAGSLTAAAGNAECWRYCWYDCTWWYYNPDHHWSYWQGDGWNDYQTAEASRPARRAVQGSLTAYPAAVEPQGPGPFGVIRASREARADRLRDTGGGPVTGNPSGSASLGSWRVSRFAQQKAPVGGGRG